MGILVNGILHGMVLALFVGPSFFMLIRIGILNGFRQAGAFAVGIITSDLVILLVAYWGLSKLFRSTWFEMLFSLLAGVVVLGLGIYSLRAQGKRYEVRATRRLPGWRYTLQGFGINIMNPFTVIVWLGVLGTVQVRYGYSEGQYSLFFMGVLGTILAADLTKAYLANQLGKVLTERVLTRVNRVLGVIFVLLGLRLLENFAVLYVMTTYDVDVHQHVADWFMG